MNKPCPDCGGKVITHTKKDKELLHVCVECGVIIARGNTDRCKSDEGAGVGVHPLRTGAGSF